ncbi:MAG: hypothetical protein WKG01_04870 [Kofleriaceae bacterium]
MRTWFALVCLVVAACGNDQATPDLIDEPVYYGQVQKIINDNCVDCHSASPDRLAPFSLATFEDSRTAAEDTPMAFSVMNRVMPPYYAKQDDSCHSFHNAKWLSDADLTTLTTWINGDRREGDPADAVAPNGQLPTLAEIDRTITLPAYTPDTAVDDDYRCFVIDEFAASTFVVGVHVRPGNLSTAHHVIVYTLDNAAAEADVIAKSKTGPYECAGGPTELGATFLTGWAPGGGATRFPADTGIAVQGNRKLVAQVHYNLSHADGLSDQTALDLDTETSVVKQAAILAVRGDVNLDPGEVDAQATGTTTLPTVVAQGRMWGAMVHMHERGTGALLTSVSDANACLLDLEGWSFHWQHFYWHTEPIPVRGGDTFRLTCHFDTTGDAEPVTWGEGTEDEMCLAYFYISQ